jgi:hypothetical protein
VAEWDFYSFDNFLNGIVDKVYYGNNPSLDPADAGATWDYDIQLSLLKVNGECLIN